MDNDKTLKKLEELIKVIDEGVTKEEFIKSFEKVIDLVLKIEKRNSEAVVKVEETYKNLLEKFQNDHTSSLSDLKGQVNDVFVGDQLKRIKAEHDDLIALAKQKIASVRNGKDGRDGINGKDGKNGRDGRDGVDGKDGKDGVDGLMGQGAGGGAKGRIHYFDLTDQCNGVLKTFKIPSNFGVLGVWGTQYPTILRPMVDWTTGNKTITLTSEVSAPETGQTLWLQYIK